MQKTIKYLEINMLRWCLLIFLFTALSTYGQSSSEEPLKDLIAQTQRYQASRPYEKVHLHLDKPYYAIGDHIWFKAYVVQGEQNQPTNLSKILYVDLINEQDTIKQTLKLPLLVGLAWGEFNLSDTLKEGNYRIRAYTNWMRNFGEDYFYEKNIPVGNAITNNIITTVNYSYAQEGAAQKVTAAINYKDINGHAIAGKEVSYEVQANARTLTKSTGKTDSQGNLNITFTNTQPATLRSGTIHTAIKLDDKRQVEKSFPAKVSSGAITLQFFPEGGDLVAGLGSRVAFKATDADGRSISVSGYLTDHTNNQIAALQSEHVGMGTFAFRPQAGTTYKAIIKTADGTEKSFDLPASRPNGYTLAVSHKDTANLQVSISATPDQADQEIILLAQSNNKIHYVTKSKLNGTRLTANIPKNKFPQGILHLTLFSQNEPMAERLTYINHQEQLNIKVTAPKKEYTKRESTKLTLQVTDQSGKPVLGSFSLSVIDETKVPYDETKETTIHTNLLLTSDLKGYIQAPNYYFTNPDETKARHLDNLLLTQGWRRFTWKEIQNNTSPPLAYQPEQSQTISGTVTLSGKPVAGGKVTLFYLDTKPVLKDTLTDAQGKFRFTNLYFPDSTKLVIQARNAKDRKNVKIELDQVPLQLITKNRNPGDVEVNVNKTLAPYLKNSMAQYDSLRRMGSGSIMLGEVKIVERKTNKVLNSASLIDEADVVITAAKLKSCFDLTYCLQGMIPGVEWLNGVPFLKRVLHDMNPIPMYIMVDGAVVDTEYLTRINPDNIEGIEVLKSAVNAATYGSMGRGGVLIITMKRGGVTLEESMQTYTPGVAGLAPKGFYKVREFYSPDYNDPKVNVAVPDLRTTVYWNPQVITDTSGKAAVEFFNADGTGTYKVIVEGISEFGNIGRSIYRYRVQ